MLNINNKDLPLIIEALLLAANNPMSIQDIMLIFDETERPTAKEIETAIALLQQPKEPRGIELVKVANGYQFQSKQKFAHLVGR